MHEAVGFRTLRIAGVEPSISADDESYNALDGKQRERWLNLLFEVSTEPHAGLISTPALRRSQGRWLNRPPRPADARPKRIQVSLTVEHASDSAGGRTEAGAANADDGDDACAAAQLAALALELAAGGAPATLGLMLLQMFVLPLLAWQVAVRHLHRDLLPTLFYALPH